MDEEDEPQPPAPARRALPWALVLGAAAAAFWIAARPLEGIVPAPPAERPRPPVPAAAPFPTVEVAPEEPPPPLPTAEDAPPAVTLESPPPPTDWFEEGPGEGVEPSAHEALRDRLQRQLAMNDLHGVRVEIAGDRVVTSGFVAQPGDRQRLALIVRSLAPDRVHEDHAEVTGRR